MISDSHSSKSKSKEYTEPEENIYYYMTSSTYLLHDR